MYVSVDDQERRGARSGSYRKVLDDCILSCSLRYSLVCYLSSLSYTHTHRQSIRASQSPISYIFDDHFVVIITEPPKFFHVLCLGGIVNFIISISVGGRLSVISFDELKSGWVLCTSGIFRNNAECIVCIVVTQVRPISIGYELDWPCFYWISSRCYETEEKGMRSWSVRYWGGERQGRLTFS